MNTLNLKTTNPYAKFIRTTEGWLVGIFGLILFVLPLIDNVLPPAVHNNIAVGKWILIVTIISRTGLKIVQSIAGPVEPPKALSSPVLEQVGKTVEQIESEIEVSMQEIASIQNAPGTPEGQINHGLAPDESQQESPPGFMSASAPDEPAPMTQPPDKSQIEAQERSGRVQL